MLNSVQKLGILKTTKSSAGPWSILHHTFSIQPERWIVFFISRLDTLWKVPNSQVNNNSWQLMYITKEVHNWQIWIAIPTECLLVPTDAFWKRNRALIREYAVKMGSSFLSAHRLPSDSRVNCHCDYVSWSSLEHFSRGGGWGEGERRRCTLRGARRQLRPQRAFPFKWKSALGASFERSLSRKRQERIEL